MSSDVAELDRPAACPPENWHEIAVADVVAMLPGFAFKSENFVTDTDAGLPLIRIRDLGLDTTATRYVGTYDEAFAVQDGDILVGMDGTFEAVRWQGGKALLNQRVLKLSPTRPDAIDEGYLFYRVQPALAELEQTISGTTVKHLSTKDLKRLTWKLPPLDEQGRIAEVLRSVDEAIAASKAIADKAQTVWQGLTEERIWDRLEQNADLARPLGSALKGSDYGVNASLVSEPVGHAILRMGNLQDGYIDPTDLKWAEIAEVDAEVLALDVGDILFNRTNSRDLVGKVALVREPTDFLYASYIVRLRVNQSVADPYYLFAVLHSHRAQSQFKSIATPGVSQSNINPTNLKKQVIPLPSLAEQQDIAEELQSVEIVRRTAVDELVTLRQIKSDLMSDLLSGRVRVSA